MTLPLARRLADAAVRIYLGETIYSDQVHGLLIEAAGAVSDESTEWAVDRVACWTVRRLSRAQRATMLGIQPDETIYAPSKRAETLHALHLLAEPKCISCPTELGRRVIAILKAAEAAK